VGSRTELHQAEEREPPLRFGAPDLGTITVHGRHCGEGIEERVDRTPLHLQHLGPNRKAGLGRVEEDPITGPHEQEGKLRTFAGLGSEPDRDVRVGDGGGETRSAARERDRLGRRTDRGILHLQPLVERRRRQKPMRVGMRFPQERHERGKRLVGDGGGSRAGGESREPNERARARCHRDRRSGHHG
jgi:hypothetical protein